MSTTKFVRGDPVYSIINSTVFVQGEVEAIPEDGWLNVKIFFGNVITPAKWWKKIEENTKSPS